MGGHEAVGFCAVCYRKASMRKGKSVGRTKSPVRNGRFRMRWDGGGMYPARHYGRQRPSFSAYGEPGRFRRPYSGYIRRA